MHNKNYALALMVSSLGLILSPSFMLSMDSKIAQDKMLSALSGERKQSIRARHTKQAKDSAENAAKKSQKPEEIALRQVEAAIDTHNLEGVRAYIVAGGNPNAMDGCGNKLLDRAVQINNREAAQLLLDHGAQINGDYKRNLEMTPLHHAVRGKSLPMIELLLDNKADIEARTNGENHTPLMEAVVCACYTNNSSDQSGYLSVIDLLLRRGANMETESAFGITPLLKTVCTHYSYNHADWESGVSRRLPVIKSPMRWGADYQLSRRMFDKFLCERKRRCSKPPVVVGELESIASLEKYLRSFPAEAENESIAACLFHLSVDPHAKIDSQLGSIMKAYIKEPNSIVVCQNQRLCQAINDDASSEVKKMIAECHELLERADELGYTPLLRAVYQGKPCATKVLCDLSANLDARNVYGQTAEDIMNTNFKVKPIYPTDSLRFLETIICLKNALLFARQRAEQAKIKAEQEGVKKKESYLLAQSARLRENITDDRAPWENLNKHTANKKYPDGSFPLIQAAGLGNVCMVKELLAYGAQLSARDDNYHTALMAAVINGHADMVAFLLTKMSPAEIAATVHGQTAYDLAKERVVHCEKLLLEKSLPEYTEGKKKYEHIMMLFNAERKAP